MKKPCLTGWVAGLGGLGLLCAPASIASGTGSAGNRTDLAQQTMTADEPTAESPGLKYAKPRLLCETTGAEPGKTLTLGLSFAIEPGWHLYWRGNNDSGLPISITSLKLPAGWTAGKTLWPTPKRHIAEGDILDHIYEHEVTLLIPVSVPKDAKVGSSVTIALDTDFLVCKGACIPGSASVSLKLDILKPGEAKDTAPFGLFINARSTLPAAWPTDPQIISATWAGDELTISAPRADQITFMPDEDSPRPDNFIKAADVGASTMKLKFPAEKGKPTRVTGIVKVVHLNKFGVKDPSARSTEAAARRVATHAYTIDTTAPVAASVPTSPAAPADKPKP